MKYHYHRKEVKWTQNVENQKKNRERNTHQHKWWTEIWSNGKMHTGEWFRFFQLSFPFIFYCCSGQHQSFAALSCLGLSLFFSLSFNFTFLQQVISWRSSNRHGLVKILACSLSLSNICRSWRVAGKKERKATLTDHYCEKWGLVSTAIGIICSNPE